jgi:hypothetical protein
MLLDQNGLALSIAAIQQHFPTAPPDIICLDPIRNLFDGRPDGDGENDNTAMLFFLQQRVEALREAVAPDAGLILCHHTKTLGRKALLGDPFMALSGASALRSFYTSGMIMFRPEEDRPERRLEIELRNGPALDTMLIDKRGGRWVELDPSSERLVRKDLGAKLDAERVRRHDVILQSLADEAEAGRLYSITAFAETFENRGGLGGADTIRDRINVLASKGYIRFLRDASAFGLPYTRSKFGYLVVEGMVLRRDDEVVDPETAWGERHAIPYEGVPVGTIKRFATGRGNANKTAMIAAMQARGFHPGDDNEADALSWAARPRSASGRCGRAGAVVRSATARRKACCWPHSASSPGTTGWLAWAMPHEFPRPLNLPAATLACHVVALASAVGACATAKHQGCRGIKDCGK